MKSNWSKTAAVPSKLTFVLVVALAAAASAAQADDHHNKHKSHSNHSNNHSMFDSLEQFDHHVRKVGKPTQNYSKPSKKPYLNPNAGSDHPPLAGGWWLGVSTHDHGHGPEVVHISYGSPASRIGLEQGDIIHEVDGVPVTSRWELSEAIRYSDGYVRLLVEDVRTGQFVYRMVRLTRRNNYSY